MSVGTRMSHRYIANADSTVLTIFPELVIVEVGAKVGDDSVWEAIAMYDVIQEVETLSALGVVTGLTSIHLVNLSIATNTLLRPPGAFGKGPIMSSPQQTKGQVGGIVISL